MEKQAYSIDEFCERHGDLSRSFLYKLWPQGLGPRFMRVGTRRLISKEAEAEWRSARERGLSKGAETCG